jgi:signal transduction histidine kinase
MDKLNFRISSKLKDLIGRELITDDFIAVFELVKNAFDAYATKVKIVFENNLAIKEKSKIIIIDNGKGMEYDDLINRWLFVAYSAKDEGTEDDNLSNDYRNKIKLRQYYAGAKGVGRFSADRLGEKLNLISIKDKSNAKIENLEVHWDLFEEDSKKEFIDVSVIHRVLSKHSYKIKTGTILEISGLRSKWDRNKLKELKSSLSKLIRPQITKKKDIEDDFKIIIEAPDEKLADDEYIEFCKDTEVDIEERKVINGPVKNFIFETLNLKTTSIQVEISKDGEKIKTILTDRGKRIYEIEEYNKYKELKNISYYLFFLNQTAKFNFSRLMGVQPVNYGNVFMYKNGFRIYPYGQERDDTLGIDARKAQGQRRYLGTRELIGRIEIWGLNPSLRETTSRADGLIATNAYSELKNSFIEKVLRRLEKYVVDTKEWGVDDEELKDLTIPETKKRLVELLANITRNKDIIRINYDDDIIQFVRDQNEDDVLKLLRNFKRIAVESDDNDLKRKVNTLEKKFKRLKNAKNELEEELESEKEEKEELKKENLFLRSVSTADTKEIISLQHHIDRGSFRIKKNLDNLKNAIEAKKEKEVLLNYIEKISLENKKISTLSRFVTKANFNLMSSTISADLITFIKEYIENVYTSYKDLKINNKLLNISFNFSNLKEFKFKFRPLEFIIIIDNLIDNSQKNGAKKVEINIAARGESIQIRFKDDGKGIPDKNLDKIFNFGFTTTDGSGLGLFHINQIISKMGGSIEVNNKLSKGVEFILGLKK